MKAGAGRGGGDADRVSLVPATAIVVGNMIGIGVFTGLGFQAAAFQSPFALLMVWVLGGVVALCGALCYAELAAAIPRSGGEYHFLSRVFHPFFGFLSGWVSVTVGFAAPVAAAAMAFGGYLSELYGVPGKVASCALVALVTGVHLSSVRVGGRFQSVFTIGKVALILVIVGWAFLISEGVGISFLPGEGDWGMVFSGPFAIAMFYVMYAYSGWNASTYVMDDVVDARRTVPRSLLLGTGLVTLIYVALNAAFLYTTPMAALAGSGEKVALVASREIFGARGGEAVTLLISFGLISSVSAMTWAGPRVAMTMGEDRRLLNWLSWRSVHGVPRVALLWQAAVVFVLVGTSSFEAVVIYIEVILVAASLLTVGGVIYLRWREPDLERPYRAWGYPVTPLVFMGMSVWMLVYGIKERPAESFWGAVTLFTGAGGYLVSRWLERRGGERKRG
ncbi:MAG: amino acid permease [Verrucomicrobiota bacterium]